MCMIIDVITKMCKNKYLSKKLKDDFTHDTRWKARGLRDTVYFENLYFCLNIVYTWMIILGVDFVSRKVLIFLCLHYFHKINNSCLKVIITLYTKEKISYNKLNW